MAIYHPGTYAVFKKVGAAKFTPIPPTYSTESDKYGNYRLEKNGAVLLEVAKSNDGKIWDWQNKITFAIGIADIALIFNADGGECRIVHDNDGAIKTLALQPGEGKYAGTWKLMLSDKSKDQGMIMVPLSAGEYAVLMELLVSALPKLVAWD